jgi:hypothetical protein
MLRILNNPPIIRVRLKHPDVLTFTYHYAHRLTSKGLFLVVKTPSLPGAQVRFELLLESGDIIFAGIGEITWIKPFPDAKGFYGMIIRFIHLDEGSQEILQLALSQKDASRKEAFDHQKIAEDPLPDDQMETTPFISPWRSENQPTQNDLATNRYHTLQRDMSADESPTEFGVRQNLEATRLLTENKSQLEEENEEENLDEAPTEDIDNQSTKRSISLRPTAAISEYMPTSRNPSLALIEGLAAQKMQARQTSRLPLLDDASDIATRDNLRVGQRPLFSKALANEEDETTDSLLKESFLPKTSKHEALSEEEGASLEFISKHQPNSSGEKSDTPLSMREEPGAAHLLTKELREKPLQKESLPRESRVLATTKEQDSTPQTPSDENLAARREGVNASKHQTDPRTNIRLLLSKPIPVNAAEQDAEMERMAHEAGLADLDSLVGWSKDLIRNMPRTPAQIEQELMALAIASKKLY